MLAGPGTQRPGRRPRRVHMPVPADTSGRGLCSGVHLHDRGSSGTSRPPPSPPWRELGATGGNGREPRRQQGGGFPGALWPYRCGPRDPGAPPRLCVLGLIGAGTPGLGQAQKSPFPDQAPSGGSGDRGGYVEPGVTAGSGASISRRAPSAPGATTVPARCAGGRCSATVPGRSWAHPFAPASASAQRD